MMRRTLFAVFAVGCGTDASVPVPDGGAGSGPSGTCPTYQVPASTDLMSPKVSFATQVMPIFHATCSNDACHGSGEPQGGVYFGSNAQMVYANLVGVAALELPSMSLVEAGDPSNSFVMHKLDSDQCAFSNECAPPGCGAQMPMGSTNPMPLANRNTIRRWIAQGATQN